MEYTLPASWMNEKHFTWLVNEWKKSPDSWMNERHFTWSEYFHLWMNGRNFTWFMNEWKFFTWFVNEWKNHLSREWMKDTLPDSWMNEKNHLIHECLQFEIFRQQLPLCVVSLKMSEKFIIKKNQDLINSFVSLISTFSL